MHLERFGTTTVSRPWERLDGEVQEHDLIFSWPDGRHLTACLHDELVWKPALAAVGVIPPPYKDNRGRRRFKTDRTTGLHALRHYFASITPADSVNIKELSECLGHHDPGFTLQMYTHMLPSSYDRARQAVDRRLTRLAQRLTDQSRSRGEIDPQLELPIQAPDCSGPRPINSGSPFKQGYLKLSRGLAQQAAGDDQLLDLLGAFEDVEDLCGAGERQRPEPADSSSDLGCYCSLISTADRHLSTSHGAVTEQDDRTCQLQRTGIIARSASERDRSTQEAPR